MKRLLILIACIFCFPLTHAASTSLTRVESSYKTLGLPISAGPEKIKKKFRQLAIRYHPDKNPGNEQAAVKYKEISEAYSFLLNTAITLTQQKQENEGDDQYNARAKALLPFLRRCDQCQNLAKKFGPEQVRRIEALKLEVEEQGYASPSNEQVLNDLERGFENQRKEMLKNFLDACEQLRRIALVNKKNDWEINMLIRKVRDQEGLMFEEDEHELNHLRLMARIETAQQKIDSHSHNHLFHNTYMRLHHLWMHAFEKKFTDADEHELRTIEESFAWEEASKFISLCKDEMRPCGNSIEHYERLQRLIEQVLTQKQVSDADRQELEQIKHDKYNIFIAQCARLQQDNIDTDNSYLINNNEVDNLKNDAYLDPKINRKPFVSAYDQQKFAHLSTRMRSAKLWKTRKETGKWILSVAAPIALALGQGLLLNLLAHRAGSNLKQVAFYKAPAREWAIGLSTLCLQGLLGINLGKKLKTKFSHSFSGSLYAAAYLMSIGALQHLGERLPLGGTGWRSPINPGGSLLANLLLSNSSLFMGSAGGVAFALSKAAGY